VLNVEEKDLFPDYRPKETPDTIYDYLREPKTKIFQILSEIGEPTISKLDIILDLFIKLKKAVNKSLGLIKKGNIAIGADPNQYYPTEEELLLSELGKMINEIIVSNSKENIEKIKKENGIQSQRIVYHEICFHHVDVMGSGRYFYANKKKPKTELII
jgi:hypothetical protein